ncbi:jerky protein homolog-like [Schistocerca gregaria]|uniref:jerky protein homolog-like n=1 Tax=Schistocerca gregaria TaxID=7010 RepID=UPI00211F34C4|nr:jerky protein homolog-like [Schistocerca gregaria]
MKSLPVYYRNQKIAWMGGKLLKEWFHGQFVPSDREFSKENNWSPYAILLTDNARFHPSTEEFCDVEIVVKFMPLNVTPLLQPIDQGVLQTLKLTYRKQFLRTLIHDDSIPLVDEVKKANVKDVVYWAVEAWLNISEITLRKSWRKLLTFLEFQDNLVENEEENLLQMIQAIPGCEEASEEDIDEWVAVDVWRTLLTLI